MSNADWLVVDDASDAPPGSAGETPVDVELLSTMFPGKAAAKLREWVAVLHKEEVERVGDARDLLRPGNRPDWDALPLPAAVRATLHARFSEILDAKPAPPPPAPSPAEPSDALITQLDCVVLDVSCSMTARSAMDALKTREDVSKILFHCMVDKILCLEMNHAVSLVSFGAVVQTIKPPTTQYEDFHDEIGRLGATQSATKLFDAVADAADMLLEYARVNPSKLAGNCPLRVFALTDGEDNRSTRTAAGAAQHLQRNGVVLDALSVGNHISKLEGMAKATGGLFLRVIDESQSVALFESERLLHVDYRDEEERKPKPFVASDEQLMSYASTSVKKSVAEMKPTQSPFTSKKTVSSAVAVERATSSASSSSAAGKRVLKEFKDITGGADPTMTVHMVENSLMCWKAIIQSEPSSPYGGAFFVTSLEFPQDYPFKPPRFRFLTRVFHCNVSESGAVCLDILKSNWSPALSAGKVLLAVRSLLSDPNPADPLDAIKGQLYMSDPAAYAEQAASWAGKYAYASWADAAAANHIES